jgi:BirA family transcriptional regulator, biotin operon repressor / biotin---[acetyl-CoA-carboxylase] ligase
LADTPLKGTIGTPFIELQSIDSTNNYALTRVHAGLAPHGTAFFAHEQVAGKGQRGRAWKAEKDSSIITSVVIDPRPLLLANQFHLSACVAFSACEWLESYTGDDTKIKWPNDIYWQDRKAGGILIENIIAGISFNEKQGSGWQWAIAGIGININQERFPEGLGNPVSLRQITGRQNNPVTLVKGLYEHINKNWNMLVTDGFENIYSSYLQRLYKKDLVVKLKKGSRIFEATIRKVSTDGLLVVQHAMEEEFRTGDVEWILSNQA